MHTDYGQYCIMYHFRSVTIENKNLICIYMPIINSGQLDN